MQVNAEQNARYQLLQQECRINDPNATDKIPTEQFRRILENVGGVTDEEIDEMVRLSDEEEGEINYATSLPKLAGFF